MTSVHDCDCSILMPCMELAARFPATACPVYGRCDV